MTIEVQVLQLGPYGAAQVRHRWRALDAEHNIVERAWSTFANIRDLPPHITHTGRWYEDMGHVPD